MTKLYIDAGTSWSKVLEIYEDEKDLLKSPLNKIKNLNNYIYKEENRALQDKEYHPITGRVLLFPSKFCGSLKVKYDAATGHMAKKRIKEKGIYQNEMLCFAYGAKKLIGDEELQDTTIVDIGSRDTKWVRFVDGKYKDLDWNGNCGSATGATVEMLTKFYNVDVSKITPQEERIPVTCGVFSMEKIMDDIASDVSPDIAIAKYINGLAHNTWNFSGRPKKMYLSGGFCMNKCFLDSLDFYCDVVPLGRLVLLEGLY